MCVCLLGGGGGVQKISLFVFLGLIDRQTEMYSKVFLFTFSPLIE